MRQPATCVRTSLRAARARARLPHRAVRIRSGYSLASRRGIGRRPERIAASSLLSPRTSRIDRGRPWRTVYRDAHSPFAPPSPTSRHHTAFEWRLSFGAPSRGRQPMCRPFFLKVLHIRSLLSMIDVSRSAQTTGDHVAPWASGANARCFPSAWRRARGSPQRRSLHDSAARGPEDRVLVCHDVSRIVLAGSEHLWCDLAT